MNEKIPIKDYERSKIEQTSLNLFHEGQAAAIAGDTKIAISKIEESLMVARNENNTEWINYLEATIAYLNGDLTKLNSLLTNAGSNNAILMRLALGLEKRGLPDYKKDYYNI